jgi:hypothetical protein
VNEGSSNGRSQRISQDSDESPKVVDEPTERSKSSAKRRNSK